jgi:hypothetical protein
VTALPTETTKPRTALQDLSILLYGPSKIGKSTFCSRADDCLFLATEPGLNGLETFQVPITSWVKLLEVCREIEAGEHPFRVLAIDTVDNAYKGKAYALINGEFHRVLNRLAFLPLGLVLISHSEEREISTRTGKRHRIVPSLPEKARRIVLDLVDVIAFCDLEEEPGTDGKPKYRRVIRTRPTPRFECGDRTGRLPPVLDLDFHLFREALEGASSDATKTNDQRTE